MRRKKSKELGERQMIEIIHHCLDQMPNIAVPFGDDVSGVEIGYDRIAVLKTDMLVDKTDVPKGMSVWQAARKAVVMNVSDFAAKGVQPIAALVSLGLPKGVSKREIEKIGSGLNSGAREYGAYIVGGDTGEASDIVISIALFGISEKNALTLRSGARPNDIIAVTGMFGKTSAGLKILQDGIRVPEKISRVLADSVLMPMARLNEGIALARSKTVTAAIDSSDGLAWSLLEIARSSNVGITLEKLPIADEVKRYARISKSDLLDLCLYGGEEYELVVAVRPKLWNLAKKAVEESHGELTAIGKVTVSEGVYLETHHKRITVEPKGYEHFRT